MADQYSGFSPLTAANMQMLETLLPPQQAASPMPSLGSGVSAYGMAPGQRIGDNYVPTSNTQSQGSGDWLQNILNQPITKGILNVLSTPAYMVGNSLDSLAKDQNDPGKMAFDSTIGAIGKGLSAGFGQNTNDAVMPSKGLKDLGFQTENPVGNLGMGFAADMLLDPLTYVGGGPIADIAKGAVRGASEARYGNALAKAGSGMAQPQGVLNAAIQGGKQGYADYKAGLQDAKSVKDMETAAAGQGANDFTENVPGLNLTAPKLADGEAATMTANDIANVSAAESNARNLVASPVGTDNAAIFAAPTDPQNAAFIAKLAEDHGNLPPELQQADAELSKAQPVPSAPNSIDDSVNTVKAGAQSVPDSEAIVNPDKVITDKPPLTKASNYDNYTVADRYVAGLDHLEGQVPKYSGLKADQLNDYLGTQSSSVATGTDWPGVISELKSAPPNMILRNKTNPKSTLKVNQLGDMMDADFAENPKKFDPSNYEKFLPESVVNRHSVIQTQDVLPTPEGAAQLGLDPEDFTQALADGHVNNITKPTGNLKQIFDQLSEGKIDPASTEKFHNFMKGFTDNPDISLEDSIQSARDFLENNHDAVASASKSLRATSDGGRLRFTKGAGDSPAVSLNRVVDPDTAEYYRVPYTEENAAKELGAQSLIADRDIALTGPHSAFVSQLADDTLKSTFKVQEKLATTPEGVINGPVTWTTASAIHPYSKVSKAVSDYLFDQGYKGRLFAHVKDQLVMSALGKVDAEMKKLGVFPYLTDSMEKGGVGIRASVYDVLSSIPESERIHFLGYKLPMNAAHLLPTQIMDGAETLLRTVIDNGGRLDRASVKPEVIDAMKGKFSEKDIESEIALNLDQAHKDWNAKLASNVTDATKFEAKRTGEMGRLYKALSENLPTLAEKVLRNNALHGEVMTRRIKAISEDTVKRLSEAFSEGSSVGNAVDTVASMTKPIRSEMEPEAAKLANQATQEVKNEFASPMEQIHADASDKTAKIANKQTLPEKPSIASRKMNAAEKDLINKSNAEALKRTQNPMLNPDNLNDALEGGTDSFIDLAREDAALAAVRRRFGFQRVFNTRFGKWANYDVVTSGTHATANMLDGFNESLNEINRMFEPNDIKLGFKNLQAGEAGVTPATESLQNVMGTLFDDTLKNVFSRNGMSADHFNEILDAYRAPKEWRFTSEDPVEMSQEWKSWTVDNPLGFMQLMNTAIDKGLQDIHMGAQFSLGGLKNVPKGEAKDFVKIDPKSIGDNRFAKLIDKSLYYPREIAQQIPEWNRVMIQSRTFKGTFGEIMHDIVDPIVTAMKMTNTVVKPGHSVMSLIGDILTNSLLGMNSLKLYKANWRVMSSRRQLVSAIGGLEDFARTSKNQMEGVALKAADSAENSVRFTNIIGKGPVNLRNEDLFALFENHGIYLPMHHGGVAEDWLTPADGIKQETHLGPVGNTIAKGAKGINQGIHKLLNNRIIKMNQFTSERDNFSRGALAIHYMQSKPFNNFQEAVEYAAAQMRRVRPTAKDFTAAESKYVRRLFFYYTWQRGMLPVIAERAIARPGVAMAPAKFSYDLAQANGLNPQSMGDPFPSDQLFPKYYQDMVLGPQWKSDDGHEWGFNPTSPVLDTLNSLGAGVSLKNLFMNPFDPKSGESQLGRTFLGMTNPFIKTPMDLISGTDVGTGVPIKDPAEYLQDQVGPARFLSQATGKDLISSTNGIGANRSGTAYAKGFATPQAWWDNAAHAGANYLTGLQFKDFTSDAAQKSAKYDQTHNNPNKPSNTRAAQAQAARGGMWFGK